MLIVGVTRAVPFIAGWSAARFAGLLFSIKRLFTALRVSSTFSLNVADVNEDLIDTCEGTIGAVAIGFDWCSTIGRVSFDIGAIIGEDFSRLGVFEIVC